MGEGTRFDPDILEEAYNALSNIPRTIDEDTNGLGSMQEASEVMSDIGMDNSKGGWSYLADEISNVTGLVSTHVTNVKTASGQVHQAMRASIDTLHGADQQNEQSANQQNTEV